MFCGYVFKYNAKYVTDSWKKSKIFILNHMAFLTARTTWRCDVCFSQIKILVSVYRNVLGTIFRTAFYYIPLQGSCEWILCWLDPHRCVLLKWVSEENRSIFGEITIFLRKDFFEISHGNPFLVQKYSLGSVVDQSVCFGCKDGVLESRLIKVVLNCLCIFLYLYWKKLF